MRHRGIWNYRAVRVAAALGVAGLAVFAPPPAPAQAHATLVTTKPARNAVVPNPPAEVTLTFSEPVRVVPDRIKVVDPDGDRADAGQPRVEGQTVRIGLRAGGPKRGTYVVSFRVTSADNHPVGGAYSFSVVSPSAPGAAAGADASGSGRAVAIAFPVVRGLGYAALALLVGAALVLALLWPRRLDRRAAVRLLWAGAIALAVTSVFEVLLQIWYQAGSLTDIGWSQARAVVLGQYGVAHAVRIGVALVAPSLLRPLLNGGGTGGGNGGGTGRAPIAAVVVGVVGLATWPASGHPVASPVPALSLVADLTHLAAMSVWLGGLAMLAVVLLPRANATELAGIVPVWSRWAQVAVATLLATGLVQSLVEVGSVGALFGTTYGWLVVAKVGLLAAVLGLAWQSRRLVAHVAGRTKGAAARLRGLVAAEAAGIAVVVAVASVLVQTPPARGAEAAAAPTEQTVLLSTELYQLSVQILPGAVGLNELHLYAFAPDGAPADVKEWRAWATPSDQDIERIPVDILPVPPDHAIGGVQLPRAGPWLFTFTLRTTEIDQAAVTATFDIRPA